MTKQKSKSSVIDMKALMEGEDDYLRLMMRSVVEATLEAEMSAALGAEKGERTGARLGYRSGYYTRSLVTRVGTLEIRVPQSLPPRRRGTGTVGSRRSCLSGISVRRRHWWGLWRRCMCKACPPAK